MTAPTLTSAGRPKPAASTIRPILHLLLPAFLFRAGISGRSCLGSSRICGAACSIKAASDGGAITGTASAATLAASFAFDRSSVECDASVLRDGILVEKRLVGA